jgi:hypothetical protein
VGRLGKAVDENLRHTVDEAEERRVADREDERRNHDRQPTERAASCARRRIVEQPVDSRGDVAAVDERADGLGD